MKSFNLLTESKGTVIYLSHGGGPLPILGDQGHLKMVAFMKHLPEQIPKPDAIIVISAHWEEPVPTVLGAPNPQMLYDYYGFPAEAYTITYPVSGSPGLASQISSLLSDSKMDCKVDNERGFDHGMYIPLKLMYPDATIPSIQISLVKGLDPALHIGLGKALRPLLSKKILVIGSGFSFHNMRQFGWDGSESEDSLNNAFQDWLIESSTQPLAPAERLKRLIEWQKAPSAKYCHPREEHLMPLHVCVGIAGEGVQAKKIFDDYILGKRAIALQW